MRLLLDEHVDTRVAEGLRREGHDAVAVAEVAELRGRDDEHLLGHALHDERAFVTYDVRDFMRLVAERAVVDTAFPCVVLVSERSYPQGAGPGPLVRALSRLLALNPAPGAMRGRTVWLGSE